MRVWRLAFEWCRGIPLEVPVIAVILFFGGVPLGCAGPAELPPEAETGLRDPVETPTIDPATIPSQDLADALYAADQALREGRHAAAIDGYERILRSFDRSSPTVETIRSSLLEAQFRSRDFDAALETSTEILDGEPSATTIESVLMRRYEIGLSFLGGATRQVLGLSISAEGKGLEILDGLVEKYPYMSFADDAVYHIASWYLRREDYAEAEQLFQRLLRDYPTSQWSTAAEYRIGEASLHRLKGVEYDFSTLESAERRFRRYLKLNPAGAQSDQARAGLAQIDDFRAQRWLKVAEFYIGFEKEDAARVYLRKLRENHPDTEEGRRAAELLRGLKGGTDATQ